MGLESYRHVAYACWAGCPVLLAGLAFINRGDAYVSQGTFCYLPIRPIWYRLALTWIPRYIILATIVAIYLTIYVYTKSEFGKFDINLTSSTTSGRLSNDFPSKPTRIDRPSHLRFWFGPSNERPTSSSMGPLARTTSADLVPGVDMQGASVLLPERLHRKQTLLEALRDRSILPPKRDMEPRDISQTLHKRHKAIARQLRYMFVYPLVYSFMWFPPFINHCYFYTKEHNPPFALNCISSVCISLLCAVDCLIFSIREKPWRDTVDCHTQSNRKTSSSKSSELELAALVGDVEGPGTRNQSVAGKGSILKPERNWWDNEAM